MNQQTNEAPQPEIPPSPSAPAAETSYLAALLAGQLDSELLTLDPAEFTQQRHEIIYGAAAKRLLDGQPLAPSLLIEDLSAAGDLAIVGGTSYIDSLVEQGHTLTIAVADECAKTIREKSVARRLQKLGQELLKGDTKDLKKTLALITDELDTCNTKLATAYAYRYSSDADLDAILGDIDWLWDKWILNSYVTAIVAPQEVGKSNLSLDLCGRLISGGTWPDGTPTGVDPNCRILWIDTEMALGAMVQRLNDWGLPRGRFILPENPIQLLQLDKPADWQWIEAAIVRFRPPLMIIDALSGAHRSEEKDNDSMKVILQNLNALAQKYKMAIVIIHHIRKAGVGESDYPMKLDRVRGASAITQFCRSVLALGIPDPTQPDLRRLDSIKSNFARKPDPLGYQIFNEGLAWGAAPEVPRAANPAEAARAFCLQFFNSGPKLSDDFWEAGENEAFTKYALKAAIKSLSIKSFKEKGRDGRWFMALPGKEQWKEEVEDA